MKKMLLILLSLLTLNAAAQTGYNATTYKATTAVAISNPASTPIGELTLNATSSSGQPVIYESKTTSKCSVTGNVATLKAPGPCIILAKTIATTTHMAGQTPINFQIIAAPPPPTAWTAQQKYFAACGPCPSTGKIEAESCPNYKIGLIDAAKGEFSYNMKWMAN